MEKVFAVLLMAVMILSMTACGSENNDTDNLLVANSASQSEGNSVLLT